MRIRRCGTLFATAVACLLVCAAASAQPSQQPGDRPPTQVHAVRVVSDRLIIWSSPVLPVAMTVVDGGTILQIVGRLEDWYEVQFPFDSTRVGYVMARQVEEIAPGSLAQPAPRFRRELTDLPPAAATPTTPPADPIAPEPREVLVVPHIGKSPNMAEVWSRQVPNAAVVSAFRQRQPGDGTPVSLETVAFLWYDDDNMYVLFDCVDDKDHVRAGLSKRESITDDDQVILYLDTFGDRRRAYEFSANPLGIQRDGVLSAGRGTDTTFDTVWRSEGRLTERGFMVFMAIPFKSLRFSPTAEQRWGIALGRYIPRTSESSYWPFITSRVDGFVNQLAELHGLNRLSSGHNAHLVPYAAFTGARYLDTSTPAFVRSADGRAGFDSKTVLRDAVTLDVTVNPDFSQVESDDPQVTVNRRYEVFFPEKRPFFIENGSFFETPDRLLFSRRIIDPSVGVRVTGKARGWAVGALGMDDRAQGTMFDPDSPYFGQRAWTGAVRVQREVGKESSIGLLATGRDFASNSNGVIAADTRLKFGRNWVVTGQIAGSANQRLDDAESSRGTAINAAVSRSGRHFLYSGSYIDRSPEFRAALGFIRRVDIKEVEQYAGYTWRPKGRSLIAFGPSFSGTMGWDHQNRQRQDWYAQPRFDFYFRRQFGFSLYHSESYEAFGGVDLRQSSSGVTAYTAQSKQFSLNATVTAGKSPNYSPPDGVTPFIGDSLSASVTMTLRPHRRLRVDETYYYARLATPAGASIYTDAISRTKVNVQLTRELSVRALVDYDALVAFPKLIQADTTKRLTSDLLITYLVNPFTAVHAGYADRFQNVDLDTSGVPRLRALPSPSALFSRQVFLKISYRIGL